MTTLYRLVYASKNLLQGSEADTTTAVEHILAASRRNNARLGVTGALMFNSGAFAQVLEGPQQGVEETFERIQRDARHGDVTVLECGPVRERGFADWSMAFAGHSERGRELWSGLEATSGFDLTRLDGNAVFATLHGLVLEEEGIPHTPLTASAAVVAAEIAPRPLDVKRVREEITQLRSFGEAATERELAAAQAGHGSFAVLAVMKAALADERLRTTELRGEVDELRIVLAQSRADRDGLQTQRDLWMQRARALATMLCEDPGEITKLTQVTDRIPAGELQPSNGWVSTLAVA